MFSDDDITYFGETNFRNEHRRFGIRRRDRRAHMYVVGKTGTGKSTLLETLANQDILHGEGIVVLDPHGDMVERILEAIPAARRRDVIYFNVPDTSRVLAFNPLEVVPETARPWA